MATVATARAATSPIAAEPSQVRRCGSVVAAEWSTPDHVSPGAAGARGCPARPWRQVACRAGRPRHARYPLGHGRGAVGRIPRRTRAARGLAAGHRVGRADLRALGPARVAVHAGRRDGLRPPQGRAHGGLRRPGRCCSGVPWPPRPPARGRGHGRWRSPSPTRSLDELHQGSVPTRHRILGRRGDRHGRGTARARGPRVRPVASIAELTAPARALPRATCRSGRPPPGRSGGGS